MKKNYYKKKLTLKKKKKSIKFNNKKYWNRLRNYQVEFKK